MEYKNKVIEIIKLVLEGYKHKEANVDHILHQELNDKHYYLYDCDYLLNQIIRHYHVPIERQYYSEEYKSLWFSLGPKEYGIYQCRYKEKIVCKNNNIRCLLYKGASSTPYKEIVNKGDTFSFRDAFHVEHIIPISKIVDKLVSLDNPSDEDIENILNTICTARITKEEDRKMHNRNNRGDTFEDVYNTLYKESGIMLHRVVDEKEVDYKE